jgi:hypothetical protein
MHVRSRGGMTMKRSSRPLLLFFGILAAILTITLTIPITCLAQEAGRSAEAGPDFDRYRVTGYAVTGPQQVVSVSSSKIVLFSSPKNIPVSLVGKKVTYMNWGRQIVPKSRVTVGKRIYVVRKGKVVLIFLAQDKKKLDDDKSEQAKKK